MKTYKQPLTKSILLAFFAILSVQHSLACVCTWPSRHIDSLQQLTEYDFIAWVSILDNSSPKMKIEIKELFKGEPIKQIFNPTQMTSCSYGISQGDEWILFGKKSKTNKVLAIFACDRNVKYRSVNGVRDWKYENGLYQLKQLRKLFQHPDKVFVNENRKEYYSNGQLEIEETYLNGRIDGERKIWYPNGILFCKQQFIEGVLDGESKWFYPSGQIYDEEYYISGKQSNVSRLYFDSTINPIWKPFLIENYYKTEDSLNFVFKRIQPQYETVFDAYGNVIISREYTRLGKIKWESMIDPKRKFRVNISYHENGIISSIGYNLNGKRYGHYQTYDENGLPKTGWEYDENGKEIKKK